MKTFTQTTDNLKEINFLNNAYKCFFTDDEVEQIKKDWRMSEIKVCENCRKEVDEKKVWSENCNDRDHRAAERCGECNDYLYRSHPTFKEYVNIDSRQLLGQ